ncbi:MAG TPA: hypothetical protein PK530_12630, partial [Anaerolineales bacterium]|nr:hypothetical protein [Anaerolineales bacterium]
IQRTTQYFFIFLGGMFVIMFAIRWLAPTARFVLWQVLCPPNTHIELVEGVAELEPGEVVSAYEVSCVGEGISQPLDDFQLILVESGFTLGVAVILAVIFGWVSTRKVQKPPLEMAIL